MTYRKGQRVLTRLGVGVVEYTISGEAPRGAIPDNGCTWLAVRVDGALYYVAVPDLAQGPLPR